MGLLRTLTGHGQQDHDSQSLDLPRTVTEARLTPRWLLWYVGMVFLAVAIIAGVYLAGSALSVLPFNPSLLYSLAALPLLFLGFIDLKRRYQRYIFKEGMIQVRTGLLDVEHENVPYRRISNVASFNTLFERILGVDNLQLNLQGTDDEILVRGLRHPALYEDLIMQGAQENRSPDDQDQQDGDGQDETAEQVDTGPVISDRERKANAVRKRLESVDRKYNEGQLSEREYKNDYWYYRGQLDLLEQDEDE